MIRYALKIGQDYLKCSRRNVFNRVSQVDASLYRSKQGARSAKSVAARMYRDIKIIKLNVEVTEVE